MVATSWVCFPLLLRLKQEHAQRESAVFVATLSDIILVTARCVKMFASEWRFQRSGGVTQFQYTEALLTLCTNEDLHAVLPPFDPSSNATQEGKGVRLFCCPQISALELVLLFQVRVDGWGGRRSGGAEGRSGGAEVQSGGAEGLQVPLLKSSQTSLRMSIP